MTRPLTPTEDLFLEALAARHRLGEPWWTFEARHLRTARALRQAGLLTILSPLVEKTFRASLTADGIAACVDDDYVPPILRPSTEAAVEEVPLPWGHHDVQLGPGSAALNYEGRIYYLTDHPPLDLAYIARRTFAARLRATADVVESGEDPS